jgi:L-threonylcarbamoyladenylate synthase
MIFMIEFNMRVLSLSEITAAAAVREAVSVLMDGGLIAYPTESFYALGVMATDEEAVKRLFRLKKRPPEKPLPVIVGDIETLKTIVKSIPDQAMTLIEKYWPGPLNIIFEAKDHISLTLTGGSQKIAVRIPGDKTAFNLARASKLPITATSANPSAMPPAKNASEVKNYFGAELDLIIDNGETPGGKPSTIVDATTVPFRVLREGSIRLEC